MKRYAIVAALLMSSVANASSFDSVESYLGRHPIASDIALNDTSAFDLNGAHLGGNIFEYFQQNEGYKFDTGSSSPFHYISKEESQNVSNDILEKDRKVLFIRKNGLIAQVRNTFEFKNKNGDLSALSAMVQKRLESKYGEFLSFADFKAKMANVIAENVVRESVKSLERHKENKARLIKRSKERNSARIMERIESIEEKIEQQKQLIQQKKAELAKQNYFEEWQYRDGVHTTFFAEDFPNWSEKKIRKMRYKSGAKFGVGDALPAANGDLTMKDCKFIVSESPVEIVSFCESTKNYRISIKLTSPYWFFQAINYKPNQKKNMDEVELSF